MTTEMEELFKQYPQCLEQLRENIRANDLEFHDSYRMCFIDDAYQKRDYDNAVSCCGTFEFRMQVNYREVLVGCNYGH